MNRMHCEVFSLLHRFNRLEHPPPVDLVGLTVLKGDVPILNLTTEIFDNIASFCSGMTLDNFGRTSRAGHAYVFDAAPGLKLELMPHQRAALRWMLLRENRLAFHHKLYESNNREDPFQMQLHPFHPSTTCTKSIHVNLATLEFEHVKDYFSNCQEIDGHVEGTKNNILSPLRRPESTPVRDQRTLGQIVSQKHNRRKQPVLSALGGFSVTIQGWGKQ